MHRNDDAGASKSIPMARGEDANAFNRKTHLLFVSQRISGVMLSLRIKFGKCALLVVLVERNRGHGGFAVENGLIASFSTNMQSALFSCNNVTD